MDFWDMLPRFDQQKASDNSSSQQTEDNSNASKTSKKSKRCKNKNKEKAIVENSTKTEINDFEDLSSNSVDDLNNSVNTDGHISNENVQKIFDVKSKMSKYFVINKSVFLDLEPKMANDQEYHDYRLYKVMKKDSGKDVHDEEVVLNTRHLTEELMYTQDNLKQGIIINSNVYVTYDQWNTVSVISDGRFICYVCNFECDELVIAGHMASSPHRRRLDGHRPLKRFDLSLTRKIKDNLHCAVCNVMFPIKKYGAHENSKDHEGNLLFSINKVSDLINNIGQRKHTMKISNTQPNNNQSKMTSRSNERSLANDRNAQIEGQIFWDNSKNDFENNSNYKDIRIYEDDGVEEFVLPIEGVSYASMASKPRVNVPKFLIIDLGAKEVRVKFESWNMITQTDLNEYYCMACARAFPVRNKNNHVLEEDHKKLLAKCAVVGAFKNYLIRDVNDKLYHCGHCNNLQFKSDMQIHIEKYHPKITFKPTPISLNPMYNNLKPEEIKRIRAKLDIFGEFQLSPFGVEMTLQHLGCHTLMLINNKYHCVLCNVYVEGELIQHVYTPQHMHFINMTPFIRPFQSNLTRAIRGSLHCALCNVLIPVTGINDHNISPKHTKALALALGMVKNEPPKQDVKYLGGPGEFRNDLDRFLATLPPSSRESLSRFKVKNHKGEMFQLSEASNSSTSSYETPTPMSVPSSPAHEQTMPKPLLFYPPTGPSGIKPIIDTPAVNLLKPTMLTVSMIESGLPGVRTGSPNISDIREMDWNTFEASVSPARNFQDMEVANELLSLYNQSPVRQRLDVRQSLTQASEVGHSAGPETPDRQSSVRPDSAVRQGSLGQDNLLRQISVGHKSAVRQGSIRQEASVTQSLVRQETPLRQWIAVRQASSERQKTEVTEKESKKEKKKGKAEEKPSEQKKPDKKQKIDHDTFKLEEAVLLKLKSLYFKVTNTAFHSLVHMGNGFRYCFVCSYSLDYCVLQKHVESRQHVENMEKNKFLSTFCGQLFRQMYLLYHCAICNVTMSRKEVKAHLQWNTHIDKYDRSCKKLNKKVLKELRSGTKEFNVETQKEFVYINISEPAINIVTYIQSSNDDFEEDIVEQKLVKKSQMVILKGNVMKINFEAWHGVITRGDIAKCIVCQGELTVTELPTHLRAESHVARLGAFDEQHYPALIRKINDRIVNCVICNLELSNDDSVFEHISGRKHDKNYNSIIDSTAHADSYSDCYQYTVTL